MLFLYLKTLGKPRQWEKKDEFKAEYHEIAPQAQQNKIRYKIWGMQHAVEECLLEHAVKLYCLLTIDLVLYQWVDHKTEKVLIKYGLEIEIKIQGDVWLWDQFRWCGRRTN